MSTIVLQSLYPPPWPDWLRLCLASVSDWAKARGWRRAFFGDSFLSVLPPEIDAATQGWTLPRTDLARLYWIERLLGAGWERVVWLDADILIFDPTLALSSDGIGREAWVSKAPSGGFRVSKGVNNCVLVASDGGWIAPYRAAAEAVALSAVQGPRALGPDLLGRLHAERPFPLIDEVAMFSPLMTAALAVGDPAPVAAHAAAWGGAPKAANLCASLGRSDETLLAAARRLLADPGAASALGPGPTEVLNLAAGVPRPW